MLHDVDLSDLLGAELGVELGAELGKCNCDPVKCL